MPASRKAAWDDPTAEETSPYDELARINAWLARGLAVAWQAQPHALPRSTDHPCVSMLRPSVALTILVPRHIAMIDAGEGESALPRFTEPGSHRAGGPGVPPA
jgi:hypothetical protein